VRVIDEQHKLLIGLTNELTRMYIVIAYPKMPSGLLSPLVNMSMGVKNHSTARVARAAVAQVHVINAVQKEVERGSASRHSFSEGGGGSAKPFPVVGIRQFDPQLQRGSELSKLVEDLVTYTCKYLLVEDHMLETYAYPDRGMQQQDHELFSNEVSLLFKLVEDYNCQLSDLRRMLVFLRLWMAEHIPRDRKYAPMLIDKGVGS
jgi:hemerythrin